MQQQLLKNKGLKNSGKYCLKLDKRIFLIFHQGASTYLHSSMKKFGTNASPQQVIAGSVQMHLLYQQLI